MELFKTLLAFVFGGALLGGVVASWLAPKYLAWDNTATLGTQTVCDLPVVVERLSDQLIHAQAIGTGVGAAVFLVIGIIVTRTRKQPPTNRPAATPPAPQVTP